MRCLFLITFFSLLCQNSFGGECKHRIIFLPQTHATDSELFPAAASQDDYKRSNVVNSQLSIAKYIDANSKIPVFSEGASATKNLIWTSLTDEQKKRAREFTQKEFPIGLPSSWHTANENERSVLYEADAASIEFMREKIPAVYRVITPEDYEKVFGEIKKWLRKNPNKPWTPEIEKLVRDTRERLAIAEILKFFDEHPEQRDIILIFGSNHNFSIHPDLFEPNCVVVPYQFQSIWYGKSRGGYGIAPSANSYSNRSIR